MNAKILPNARWSSSRSTYAYPCSVMRVALKNVSVDPELHRYFATQIRCLVLEGTSPRSVSRLGEATLRANGTPPLLCREFLQTPTSLQHLWQCSAVVMSYQSHHSCRECSART